MKSVLFVCVHNSARSQMAEAFVNDLCRISIHAESAGIEPGRLNALAIAVMLEVGIDISSKQTKSVQQVLDAGNVYDYVVTVCDEASAEACPIFPGPAERIHWSFEDPSALNGTMDERLARTRVIRDEIRGRIQAWCNEVCQPMSASAR